MVVVRISASDLARGRQLLARKSRQSTVRIPAHIGDLTAIRRARDRMNARHREAMYSFLDNADIELKSKIRAAASEAARSYARLCQMYRNRHGFDPVI